MNSFRNVFQTFCPLSYNSSFRCEDSNFCGFCFPIKERQGGRIRPNRPRNCVEFVRSFPECQHKHIGVRQQVNSVTHFIDGSMIYGSSNKVLDRVREGGSK